MQEQERQEALGAMAKRDEFERNLIIKAQEDEAFKQQLLADPKSIYAEELGQEVPDSIKIEVMEEPANTVYLVLPRPPEEVGAEGELSDEALEAVAGGGWGVGSRRRWVLAWT